MTSPFAGAGGVFYNAMQVLADDLYERIDSAVRDAGLEGEEESGEVILSIFSALGEDVYESYRYWREKKGSTA